MEGRSDTPSTRGLYRPRQRRSQGHLGHPPTQNTTATSPGEPPACGAPSEAVPSPRRTALGSRLGPCPRCVCLARRGPRGARDTEGASGVRAPAWLERRPGGSVPAASGKSLNLTRGGQRPGQEAVPQACGRTPSATLAQTAQDAGGRRARPCSVAVRAGREAGAGARATVDPGGRAVGGTQPRPVPVSRMSTPQPMSREDRPPGAEPCPTALGGFKPQKTNSPLCSFPSGWGLSSSQRKQFQVEGESSLGRGGEWIPQVERVLLRVAAGLSHRGLGCGLSGPHSNSRTWPEPLCFLRGPWTLPAAVCRSVSASLSDLC